MSLLNFVGSRGGGGVYIYMVFLSSSCRHVFVFDFFFGKGEGVGQTHPKKHKKQLLKIMKILIGESAGAGVGRSVPITFNITVIFFL